MKVIQFSTNDNYGGAARAAFRLHNALKVQHVDSRMLVRNKFSSDPTVTGSQTWLGHKIWNVIARFDGIPILFTPVGRKALFSPALLPDRLVSKSERLQPDIIHLHWIVGGFMQIETLPRLRSPIVWTLHDMWPFTGGCHYSADCTKYTASCGGCPVLGSTSERDLSSRVWKRKKDSWKNVDITVITPSRWLAKCAAASSLFAGYDIRVIPNSIDTNVFMPAAEDKHTVRRSLGLPTDRLLILFGAMHAASDARKGFIHLKNALLALSKAGWGDRAEVVVFGADKPHNPPEFGMKATYMGNLSDDATISKLNYAVDVFVAPSLQDNLPNTVMESLACGTPVVAFDIGGMSDMIEHEKMGWLASPFDSEDLARGIAFMLSDHDRNAAMSCHARSKVEQDYSEEVVALKHIALYQELIGK